jgi:hypothetical protein
MKLAEWDQAIASKARKSYFAAQPAKAAIAAQAKRPMGKIEQRVRAELIENPNYTASQIGHRTNYSLRDVRKCLARIQSTCSASVEAAPCWTGKKGVNICHLE